MRSSQRFPRTCALKRRFHNLTDYGVAFRPHQRRPRGIQGSQLCRCGGRRRTALESPRTETSTDHDRSTGRESRVGLPEFHHRWKDVSINEDPQQFALQISAHACERDAPLLIHLNETLGHRLCQVRQIAVRLKEQIEAVRSERRSRAVICQYPPDMPSPLYIDSKRIDPEWPYEVKFPPSSALPDFPYNKRTHNFRPGLPDIIVAPVVIVVFLHRVH